MFLFKCHNHGKTNHKFLSNGKNRPKRRVCIMCLRERQTKVRRTKKARLVQHAGGKCILCGYQKWLSSLDFHHLDPAEKSESLSKLRNRDFNTCLAEVKKCVLLCRNCHGELETGCDKTIVAFDKFLKAEATRIELAPALTGTL